MVGAFLLEKDEVWSLERKYLIMDVFFLWKNSLENVLELSTVI